MLNQIKKIIPDSVKGYWRTKVLVLFGKIFNADVISYSQSAEDIILRKIFKDKKNGFYVDVGAFHPVIVSNTYYFYSMKNWRGINIDARPGSMRLFDKIRQRDINIEAAVGDSGSTLTYYFIDESSTMNSFSREFLIENNALHKVKKEFEIKIERFDSILDKYLPKGVKIDFLSVDAEGVDLSVLKSNNWNKYRPEVIIVEASIVNLEEIKSNEICLFMDSVGYEVISVIYQEDNIKNLFFRDKKSPSE